MYLGKYGTCLSVQNIYNLTVEAVLQRCSYKKDVLKICSKFTGGQPCRSTISIKLQSNFTEIALRHG